ncbi:hypothetical protein Tco_0526752 [Tanacetum coccineum]
MEEINNFQQEPDESLFRAWERFKELLMKCTQHYLTDMQEVILFYNGLDVPTRQIMDSKGAIPSKTATDAKIAIQEMAKYYQKWHNETSSRTRSTETFDGLVAIQAQLNNLGREIKKVNEKVYAAQFGAPYQPRGQYRAAGPGFYQRNNGNSSYPDRRPSLEESLTKFMAESAKRHEENSNIIKEIRASTDASIRNHGASIKTLEIQIGQMSKVLQERGFGSLPSSTETNPQDQVKSISTTKADFSEIRRIRCGPYALIGEGDESFDPTYGNYIELNDLDTPIETKMDQDVDFEPTFVKNDSYKMKFSSVIGYKYVIADLLPSLSINLMSKSFYYSIIKDKDEGKSHARTLIDIPVFVGSFSIISGFTIIDDDDMTKDVVLGMKFCKKYASCQMIMKKFALGDKYERIMEVE